MSDFYPSPCSERSEQSSTPYTPSLPTLEYPTPSALLSPLSMPLHGLFELPMENELELLGLNYLYLLPHDHDAIERLDGREIPWYGSQSSEFSLRTIVSLSDSYP